jgi:hypothetical protein
VLFETMVFGGKYDGEQARCSTYAEAVAMHLLWCAAVFGPDYKPTYYA